MSNFSFLCVVIGTAKSMISVKWLIWLNALIKCVNDFVFLLLHTAGFWTCTHWLYSYIHIFTVYRRYAALAHVRTRLLQPDILLSHSWLSQQFIIHQINLWKHSQSNTMSKNWLIKKTHPYISFSVKSFDPLTDTGPQNTKSDKTLALFINKLFMVSDLESSNGTQSRVA